MYVLVHFSHFLFSDQPRLVLGEFSDMIPGVSETWSLVLYQTSERAEMRPHLCSLRVPIGLYSLSFILGIFYILSTPILAQLQYKKHLNTINKQSNSPQNRQQRYKMTHLNTESRRQAGYPVGGTRRSIIVGRTVPQDTPV